MSKAIFKSVLSLCFLALVAACGTGPAADGSAAHSDAEETKSHKDLSSATTIDHADGRGGATVTKSGVVFLEQPGKPQNGPVIGPSARYFGKLVIDKDGCLRVEPGGGVRGHLPVWPPGYSLSTEGREMHVLDDQSRSVARVGSEVVMGGGEIRKDESRGGYEEKRRELDVPDKCRGPLWWIVTPVRED